MTNVLYLRYYEPDRNWYGRRFLECTWAIDLPKGMSGKEIVDIKKWTDEKVKLDSTARTYLKRDNPGEYPPQYELVVSGKGKDNRCTWCRSFRTALEKRMDELDCEIEQNDSCTFEK